MSEFNALSFGFLAANIAGKIFFPRRYGFGGIDFDTVLSESHNSQVRLTSHPVELGMAITDSIVIQPKRIVVEGVVSSIRNHEFIDWGLTGTVSNISGSLLNNQLVSKPRSTWEALIALQQTGARLTVQTGFYTYTNMVLTELNTRQSNANPNHLVFIATLEEILIIRSRLISVESVREVVERPNSPSEVASNNRPVADRAKPITKKGASDKAVPIADSGSNSSSVLSNIFDMVLG